MCDWSAVLYEKDAHRHHNLSPRMLGVSAFNFRSDFHSQRLYQTAKFVKVLHRKGWILKEMQLYHQVLTSLMNIHTYNLQTAWHVKESSEVPWVWKYILKFIWLCNGYKKKIIIVLSHLTLENTSLLQNFFDTYRIDEEENYESHCIHNLLFNSNSKVLSWIHS